MGVLKGWDSVASACSASNNAKVVNNCWPQVGLHFYRNLPGSVSFNINCKLHSVVDHDLGSFVSQKVYQAEIVVALKLLAHREVPHKLTSLLIRYNSGFRIF